MLSKLYIFVALFVCYYIFSGINEPFFLAAGAISCSLALLLVLRMNLHAEYPKLNLRFFAYLAWLFKEIVLSTISVLKIIWQPKMQFEAGFTNVASKQKTALGFTVFGNSITLTPGTVCVKVEDADGEIIIHSLTEQGRADLHTGSMDARVLEALK